MDKKASNKQLNYLNHILESKNIDLSHFTDKSIDELLHKDIVDIFKRVEIPITPILDNYKYIIEYEDTNLNYIIGKQLHTKKNTEMKLICFKNFMIIDWDLPSNKDKECFLEEIIHHLRTFPYTFYIYETYNGYHGYLVSEKQWFADWNSIKLLKELKCDEFYIGFTRKVGFVVRLNKKPNRNEEFLERFVCKVNDYPVNKELETLLKIKDSFTINPVLQE
jgi:hypothetical protein